MSWRLKTKLLISSKFWLWFPNFSPSTWVCWVSATYPCSFVPLIISFIVYRPSWTYSISLRSRSRLNLSSYFSFSTKLRSLLSTWF
jgi:hypothetical protein